MAFALSWSAHAAPLSEACKDGAAQCQAAVTKLEACQKIGTAKAAEGKKDDDKKKEPCFDEKAAADAACQTTNSACVQGQSSTKKKKAHKS